jgi:hypothetical protein
MPRKRRLSAREVEGASRTGLWAAYVQRGQPLLPVVCPSPRARVLTAELSRFAADADTAPGFFERYHNRCTEAVRVRVLGQHAVTKQRRVAHSCLLRL